METTPTFFQPPQNSSRCSLNFEDTKLAGKHDPLFTMQEFTFLPVSVAGITLLPFTDFYVNGIMEGETMEWLGREKIRRNASKSAGFNQ